MYVLHDDRVLSYFTHQSRVIHYDDVIWVQFNLFLHSEASIAAARAAVYHYDQAIKNWKPVDGGISRVDVYFNSATNAYRVVGMSVNTKQVIILLRVPSLLIQKA